MHQANRCSPILHYHIHGECAPRDKTPLGGNAERGQTVEAAIDDCAYRLIKIWKIDSQIDTL